MICTKTSVSQLLVMVCLVAACGNSQFATAHFEELKKDCSETLACKAGGIEFLAVDALDKCVEGAGAELDDASESRQNSFVATVARCGALQVCDYFGCTQSDPTVGYSMLHVAEIMNECTQAISCRIAGGQPQAQTAVSDCTVQLSNTLNVSTPQMQQLFEQRSARCRAQMGCAYVNCP
jgi:hypothetical protein